MEFSAHIDCSQKMNIELFSDMHAEKCLENWVRSLPFTYEGRSRGLPESDAFPTARNISRNFKAFVSIMQEAATVSIHLQYTHLSQLGQRLKGAVEHTKKYKQE